MVVGVAEAPLLQFVDHKREVAVGTEVLTCERVLTKSLMTATILHSSIS